MVDRLEVNFVRTWQLLAVAKLRANGGAIIALIFFFLGWLAWLIFGRVAIYADSQQARFESDQFPLPVQPAVSGVIIACNLKLAQHVREGEVLVALDARSFELQLAEAQANLKADLSDIELLQQQIIAERDARAAIADLVSKSARAGRAKVSVSQTTSKFKEQESDVLDKLNQQELASKLDKLHSEEEKATNHAQIMATSAAAAEDTSSHRVTLLDRDVRIAALEKTLTDAQSQATIVSANIDSLTYQVEIRKVRAKAVGSLADISPCTVGMTVTSDMRLATLLPDSEIRIVSLFRPEDAVGRIREGQAATLRVDNFPWTQFGTVNAVVDRVGSEPREGLVRVELHVDNTNTSIPIVHGLTAVAEVQVERISPLQVLLRTTGQQFAETRTALVPGRSPTSAQSMK